MVRVTFFPCWCHGIEKIWGGLMHYLGTYSTKSSLWRRDWPYVRHESHKECRDQSDCPTIVVKYLPILGKFTLCAWFSWKYGPFWARLINVAESCNKNRKISCLNPINFYCRYNQKHEMRFCLNLKPIVNDAYWRNFWICLYFFVHLLRARHTFLFGELLLFFTI